jgi:phosphate transport system permease protein
MTAVAPAPVAPNPNPRPAVPRRVTRVRGADVAAAVVALFASVAGTGLLFVATPLHGSFGFAVVAYAVFVATFAIDAAIRASGPTAIDRVATVLVGSAAGVALAVLVTIVWYVVSKGVEGLTGNLFTDTMDAVGPLDPPSVGGAHHAIWGTLLQVGLAALLATPLGILTAIYLSEMHGRLTRIVRFLVDSMSGVPSVVAGLFIYTTWVVGLGKGFSGLAAAMALGILMLPTVARTAEEMLRLVPAGLRESSLALGAPRWRTTVRIVLPTARNGIVTAVVLGIARIAGETAPLLMTAFGSDTLNKNVFEGAQTSLPLFIYSRVRNAVPTEIARGWAAALVLIAIVLVLFTMARVIGSRVRKAAR